MDESDTWRPSVVGFLCNWCSYAGADLAGTSRISYPEELRIIRVMCSGRVDPLFVLEAFLGGADGVMVLGCHPGDCHYISGNYMAKRKMELVSELLERMGLERERLVLDWVSAAEGDRFAQIVEGFTERIKALGPMADPSGDGGDFLEKLVLAREMVEDERLRWVVGRAHELIEKGNAFGERLDQGRYRDFMLGLLEEEVLRHQVLAATEEEPRSVKEVAGMTGQEPPSVLRAVLAMVGEGRMKEAGRGGSSPLYRKVKS